MSGVGRERSPRFTRQRDSVLLSHLHSGAGVRMPARSKSRRFSAE